MKQASWKHWLALAASATSLLIGAYVALMFALPATQAAAAIVPALGGPFGGRIITVIPCSNGNILTLIRGANAFPQPLIWSPLTDTRQFGPPKVGGTAILGKYLTPSVCMLGKIPVPGIGMSLEGTSLVPSSI